ncbi:GCN5-related N-acetyltransferase [Dethiosulfovibrio peptidovorans DSM 11002]|uniref:GCN5-related N-acetyltransferase n=1 Tax=Dethiosulfovibrio peptidovorans DSM 11002 TaxID=469381 RepID=D2Z712_9BACT|nr:GNAT family protein [Dethiosulfovibrio peptidovorans]EFC91259.1 GCN5-related N-acetyltransferase [Dethiosulfovibrio peptidovorans DSM 11002]
MIADRKTLAYIGQIDFHVIDWKNRSARIALVVGTPGNRGKGYGSEALNTLVDYGFRFMNLHRMDLLVREDNLSARRCYEKCGFVEEGRMREAIFRDGRYLDMIVMSILEG